MKCEIPVASVALSPFTILVSWVGGAVALVLGGVLALLVGVGLAEAGWMAPWQTLVLAVAPLLGWAAWRRSGALDHVRRSAVPSS